MEPQSQGCSKLDVNGRSAMATGVAVGVPGDLEDSLVAFSGKQGIQSSQPARATPPIPGTGS